MRHRRAATVSMRSAGCDRVLTTTDCSETLEEAMRRLHTEINEALESQDLVGAARARRDLQKVQLEMPAATCSLLIQEDCIAASALLRRGESVDSPDRIRAVRKLGRWLRWRRPAVQEYVPVEAVLEGLLCALRSDPEVAWAAQCALFHAVRCADTTAKSVREGTRGTVCRLLLGSASPFAFCLPQHALLESYVRAARTTTVNYFFSQLQALTLMDPGYGEDTDDAASLLPLSRQLGRSFPKVETLSLMAFEDCAMVALLPWLLLPKLKSLRVIGACQTVQAQDAVLSLLHRHRCSLVELELNVRTDFLSEVEDPLAYIDKMPQVRRLKVRCPSPLSVPWEHFADAFPALEELTFLYEQDFAFNSMEVLFDFESPEKLSGRLESHAHYVYRDAAAFARDLHQEGFLHLASECQHLREVSLEVKDTSFGYEAEEAVSLHWRRAVRKGSHQAGPRFFRVGPHNCSTREALRLQAELLESTDFEEEDERYVTEEEAAAAGAAVMLQVVRLFDDPSLESELGLEP